MDLAADKGALLAREYGSIAPLVAAVRAEVAAALMACLKSDSEVTKPAPEPTPESAGGGKTVIPFCTSGSSGYDDSGIKNLVSSDTTWLTGKRFSGNDSQSTVQTLVNGLNIKKENASANGTDGFVKVDGGKFTMGSPSDEMEREDDEIPHEVTVGSFWLSPTEVTQKEYQSMASSNPSEQKVDYRDISHEQVCISTVY